MGRELTVVSPGRIALVLVAIGLAALGGCATADAGAHRSEASGPTNAPAPPPAAAPPPLAATAPATSPTPAAPAASAPPVASAPPAAYTPPGAPAPVGPTDPKIDEALVGLDSKTPSGCRKYVSAWCRATTIPDVYRLQTCASYVTAINSLVKQTRQSGGSAIDTCDAMAQGKLPE
jgi:hypothetical protein